MPQLCDLKTGLIAETSHTNHIIPRHFQGATCYRMRRFARFGTICAD